MSEPERVPRIVTVADVKLLPRCICGQCSKQRDTTCVCGLKFSSALYGCPACGRPSWCKS